MPQPDPLPGAWPDLPHDDQAHISAMAEQARRMIALTRGLVVAGRDVDLAGLESGIGLLCAKALDLPLEQGRAARAELIQLIVELDLLSVAMRTTPL